jgi:predicted  nucleic acid-binding Zn ribbon protein
MYIQEISIEVKTKEDKDDLIDEFGLLLSFYRGSGQTQGRIESQYFENDRIVGLPFTHEKNALNKKNNNFYVDRQAKKVELLCNSKLSFRTVGKSYASYGGPCKCKKPQFYILMTNYVSISSPLTCGSCNKPVPLYRLPVYYDHGYMPILSWETNYISCDSLQMNCEVGERWALNQMQEPKSQLSKQGLEICRSIETLTNVPTYYYLHNSKVYKGDQLSRPCPICDQKWDLEAELHNHYEFKCDTCRLISTTSPYSR